VLDELVADIAPFRPIRIGAYVDILATLAVGEYRDEQLGTSGAIDYADGSLPELTWAGASNVRKAILIGTPNAGSAKTLDQLAWHRVQFVKADHLDLTRSPDSSMTCSICCSQARN